MSSTGSRTVGNPKPALMTKMLRRRVVHDRMEAGDAIVEIFRLIGSQGFAFDEEYLRYLAGRSYERAYNPRGYLRQLAACVGQPNRTPHLRNIKVPTLVMHGLNDPLVNVSGGKAIAKAIPGAEFIGFQGMGHDLPRDHAAGTLGTDGGRLGSVPGEEHARVAPRCSGTDAHAARRRHSPGVPAKRG